MARTFFFSPSEMGFFDPALFAEMPSDAVEIDGQTYRELIGSGKSIVIDAGGRPVVATDPPLSAEDKIVRERAWRDSEIADKSWFAARHREEQELGRTTTLSAEQYQELLSYFQELRDWPESPDFPDSKRRPVSPAWLDELVGAGI